MKKTFLLSAIVIGMVLASCQKDPAVSEASKDNNTSNLSQRHGPETAPTITVFASGFNNPRGLKFGPDHLLYVAEGGIGGSDISQGCDQVIPPVGPYTGSPTGSRISRVNCDGVRSTYVDNLPSSQTNASQGSLVSGVGDIAFIGNTLYAVLAGAGCSHGVSSVPNGVIRVNSNKTWKLIANLSDFQKANPVQNPEEDDFEPDGTWYSMINVRDELYAVEPNHGEMVKVSFGERHDWDRWDRDRDRRRKPKISRVIDISASQGHIVPTAVAFNDGNFYVGNLNPFPIVDGSSSIYKITPWGHIQVWAEGFTTIVGVAFDRHERMYVLENTTGNLFPTPGTGKIIRVNRSGEKETIVTGLNLPTAMTFGPDGNLYVSVWGFGPPPIGLGQILKIDLHN
ncbi:MAG: ScyD/ScyE family protein [Chitinophagaceae bacterium]